ncbi:hypothetical protein ACTI_75010 [Actinoplanes sp. OR16]|uniref:hypothetical protein n=1 Tax=Actinoplanes sp. OR16 TaxID=946334 RepID=UPI000F6FBD7E|nr:hypothetical protein [Actinoplanes sp. OR16]BBH70816.1 hypothetical protein ACTI_75010 [Actinoplanes sp. OR16]
MGMTGSGDDSELRLEVQELTELLREDSDFRNLRVLLAAHGLRASEVLLAGLIGSEDNSEYGVFITKDLRCFCFELGPSNQLIRWEQVANVGPLLDDFSALTVGIAMMRAGGSA